MKELGRGAAACAGPSGCGLVAARRGALLVLVPGVARGGHGGRGGLLLRGGHALGLLRRAGGAGDRAVAGHDAGLLSPKLPPR